MTGCDAQGMSWRRVAADRGLTGRASGRGGQRIHCGRWSSRRSPSARSRRRRPPARPRRGLRAGLGGSRDPHLRRRGREPHRRRPARSWGSLLDRSPLRLRVRHRPERRGPRGSPPAPWRRRDRRPGRVHRRARGHRRRVPEIEGLVDPSLADWTTEQKIELAQAVERAARAADDRVVAVETVVYADEEERVALASSTGLSGSGGDQRLRLPAGDRRGRRRQADRTGLRDGAFAEGARPGGDRPRGRRARRLAPRRRQALLAHLPVVLDPLVAASFAGFIGGTLCADAVQRGRSPFAGRWARRSAPRALTLTDDGNRPHWAQLVAVDAEGEPRG